MLNITSTNYPGSLSEEVRRPADGPAVRMWWLGQAGFLLRSGNFLCAIDPYLADDPGRMAPPAFSPDEPLGLAAVLCSHAHIDHLDPKALPAVARANPGCIFVVPAAEKEAALSLGLPPERLRPARDGDVITLAAGVSAHVLPSAHEELETDASGAHRALGFVLELGGRRIYHSGDCVPYADLPRRLKELRPEVALLPVNGRDAARRSRGIVGNFDFLEAGALCRQAGIPWLVAHHFGMFAGNTVRIEELKISAAAFTGRPQCVLPEPGLRYEIL